MSSEINAVIENPHFEGLPFEEDSDNAKAYVADMLGQNGKINPDGTLYRLYNHRHGILWYGDLTPDDLEDVKKVSDAFNDPIYVVRDHLFSFYTPDEYWVHSDATFEKGDTLKNIFMSN